MRQRRAGGAAARIASLLLLAPLVPAPAARPAERVEIVISREGFRPDRVTLRRGETVQLSLTTTDGEHCFAVDAFRVEKRVRPGRPSQAELTPDRTGTFVYHDCLAGPEGKPGQLVVVE
jgi:hypothetical protein